MRFGKQSKKFNVGRDRALARASSGTCFEILEQRTLFSVPVAGGVPLLSSNPSATAKLYLDFDGDAATTFNGLSVPATPAYNFSGDGDDHTTFSATELSNIREIWARVAEAFSAFNVDVTTIDPGTYPDNTALKVVIGGDGYWANGANGTANSGAFSNPS